jgi:hypothetical protein
VTVCVDKIRQISFVLNRFGTENAGKSAFFERKNAELFAGFKKSRTFASHSGRMT